MLRFSMPSSYPQCTPEPNAFGTAVKSENQVDPSLGEKVWNQRVFRPSPLLLLCGSGNHEAAFAGLGTTEEVLQHVRL